MLADGEPAPKQSAEAAPLPPSPARPLGLIACSALVIGNVIGSGFFLSPAALAPYGVAALMGWVLLGAVAICLALMFARLARRLPSAGGPYAFARKGLGPFAGYLAAWSYWVSMWVSQPAIALTFSGYLGVFYPPIAQNHYAATAVALLAMWSVGLVNMRGVRLVGLFWVHPANFVVASGVGHGHFLAAVLASLPLIMFAFLGIASSTVPADHVTESASRGRLEGWGAVGLRDYCHYCPGGHVLRFRRARAVTQPRSRAAAYRSGIDQ